MASLNPWTYLGDSSKNAGGSPRQQYTEAQKIMNRKRMEAMQKGLMGLNSYHGAPSPVLNMRVPEGSQISAGCLYVDEQWNNLNKTLFNPYTEKGWTVNHPQTHDEVKRKELDVIFNYDSDSPPIEEKKPFLVPTIYDLPWTNVSIDPMKTWMPPPPNRAEAWFMDPVELAARRLEWKGAKEEATKLREKFQPLSVLHRWVLQWHIWAEKQEESKCPPKETKAPSRSVSKGTTATVSRVSSYEKPRVKFTQYPEREGDTNSKIGHLAPPDSKGSLGEKKPLTGKLDYSQDKTPIFASLENEKGKEKDYQKGGNKLSTEPISAPTVHRVSPIGHQGTHTGHHEGHNGTLAAHIGVPKSYHSASKALYKTPTTHQGALKAHQGMADSVAVNITHVSLKPCVLDTERIVSQVLKDRVFRSHYPVGSGTLNDPDTPNFNKDNEESIAYRTHAKWVLDGHYMSDDSGDDDEITDSATTPRHVFHETKGSSSEELKKLLGPSPNTSYEGAWNDPFFLEDSDSSDYAISDSSDTSNSSEFPVISGEELEKILEEAKGTTQFHKWQNASPSMHQKEFKRLINLHRFATEAEARNQKRWRSQEKMKSRDTRTTIDSGFLGSSQPSSPPSSAQDPSFSSSTSIKPNSEVNALTGSSYLIQHDSQGISQNPISKVDDYASITRDDIKFLRELKRKYSEGGLHQAQVDKKPSPKPETAAIKPPQTEVQDNLSLRDVFMTVKPFPNIGYRTDHEYVNMFSGCNKNQENNNTEQLQKSYDGPAPKRHHMTTPFGDVSFHPGSADYHPFFHAAKSPVFKKLVLSTGRFWNLGANISLSGFWVTERFFITALNFHPWAPSTAFLSFQDQVEDFELRNRNNGIDIFVSNGYLNWINPNDDPEAIKVVLRAWDVPARIAVFEPEDKQRVAKHFVGVDMLIEEDVAPDYSGANIATIGYNAMDTAKNDPLGLRILLPGHRSITFGDITICGGLRKNQAKSTSVFARLDSGFSHGQYGRMCMVIAGSKDSGFIIGIVSGQCEAQGLNRPEALSDFVSTFPVGFKAELRRILKS